MSAHDRYLAGYRQSHVWLVCDDCGEEFDGVLLTEYGQSWVEPEECPKCGSANMTDRPMDDTDEQELWLLSRGKDF